MSDHRKPPHLAAGARRRLLALLLACAFALACLSPRGLAAPQAAIAPTPDLKDREISILKARLAASKQAEKREHIGRLVFETQLQVAALRGFPVHDVVDYAPLTGDVLTRIFNASLEEQFPGKSLEQWTWLNSLFGALPPGYDIKSQMRKLMGEQVAGLYDPDTRQLYVSESFALDSGLGRTILAHEITHAMQDQNFDLRKLGIDAKENDDEATAISAIAEGDATLAMSEYLTKEGQLMNILLDLPKMMMMDQKELDEAPKSIQQSMLFPYLQGMVFFQTLAGRTRQNPNGSALPGEAAWRSQVFALPPVSTSQIMHPEQYLADKRPAEIPPFVIKDPTRASTNVVGEFGIQSLLDSALGPADTTGSAKMDISSILSGAGPMEVAPRAARAAAGWNGDRVLIEDDAGGRQRTLHWVTKWDTAKDAGEFREALRDALKARLKDGVRWSEEGEETITAEGKSVQAKITGPDETTVDLAGTFTLAR